MITKSVTTHTF